MPLSSHLSSDGRELTIKVKGKFDFNLHKQFRSGFKEIEDPNNQCTIIVDMGEVEYMDSSALGMLLILRERAGGDDADITIRNSSNEIQKILDISNFQHMFKIDQGQGT